MLRYSMCHFVFLDYFNSFSLGTWTIIGLQSNRMYDTSTVWYDVYACIYTLVCVLKIYNLMCSSTYLYYPYYRKSGWLPLIFYIKLGEKSFYLKMITNVIVLQPVLQANVFHSSFSRKSRIYSTFRLAN